MQLRLLSILFLILTAPATLAQTAARYAPVPEQTGRADAILQARQIVANYVSSGAPGAAVAVGVDGIIVWSEGFGLADVEQQVPVRPISRFRIGSVSKPLTAAAVGLLFEQGRLDLDAPVQRYVPSFPEKKHTITTRLLAGHLAGVRHYRGDEFLNSKQYPTVDEGLAIFKDDPLLHPPGTKYSYSSYAWNLISAVVEGASGEDFLPFMQKNVFDPLGMRETVADHTRFIIRNRVRFYQRDNGMLYNAHYVDNSYKWAGGGYLSTVEDLVRFGSAHLGPGFLKAETLRVLHASQKTSDGQDVEYGIGWVVDADEAGRRRISHGGGSVGGVARLVLYPNSKVVVALLANISGLRIPPKTASEIATLFME